MKIPPAFLKNYMSGNLKAEHIPPILNDIIRFNRNVKLAVEISQIVHKKVGIRELIEVFESNQAYDGLFFFLSPLLNESKDK